MKDREVMMTVTDDEGGPGKLPVELLTEFKNDLDQINSETGMQIRQRQREAQNARFCKWPGQSPDGRQRELLLKPLKKEAFPFEGAPDSRNRLADFVTNFRAGVRFLSVLRAAGIPDVQGMEGQDVKLAAKVKILLRHVIRNQWGLDFIRQVMLSAQYVEGNDPGGCIVLSSWRREMGLEMEKVSLEDVAARLLEAAQQQVASGGGQAAGEQPQQPGQAQGQPEQQVISSETIENVEAAKQMIQTPQRAAEAAQLLVSLFPDVKPKRAKRMVKELREDGQTDFPKEVQAINQPQVRTLKLFEDIFINSNTMDLDNCRAHIPELLTAVQLRERVVSMGYNQAVVNEMLGEGGFDGRGNVLGRTKLFETEQTQLKNLNGEASDPYKGLLELVTTIYKASNEDGMPMWYSVTWSTALDKAVSERQTLYAHNRFPGVYLSREVISKYLLDSRSSAEIAMADQNLLKMFTDLAGAAGQLKSLPPMTEPLSRPHSYETGLKPFGRVKEKRPGDVKPMQMGEYSRENVDMQETIKRNSCEYFGIPHKDVPPLITDIEQQVMTLFFTAGWGEVLGLTLKLCQENMSDEEMMQITGPDGAPIAKSVAEIRGGYNVILSYNPSDLDPEKVGKKLDLIGKFPLQWDTMSVTQRDKLTAAAFYLIDPALGDSVLIPEETASAKEIEDEQRLFTMIVAAGVEPERVTEGRNFALRLQWLQNQMKQNPEPVMRAPETNRLILEAHMKYYEQMVTQQQNVQIGKEGSKRILG
jgi:hypothetical protein